MAATLSFTSFDIKVVSFRRFKGAPQKASWRSQVLDMGDFDHVTKSTVKRRVTWWITDAYCE